MEPNELARIRVMSSGDSRPNGTDYASENRRAWDHWASIGSISSRPIGRLRPAQARAMLDPDRWLPWREIHRVLCLAGGGGQQGPAFAMLGCDVTVADLSAGQLEIDRRVAGTLGLTIECLQADMCDLSPLSSEEFDLVYQPISSCYVPDMLPVYREVHRVLRPGGMYRVEHWNPAHMYLWASARWGSDGYTLPASGLPSNPMQIPVTLGPGGEPVLMTSVYPHSLGSLVGSLCAVGFAIRRLGEDCGGDPRAEVGSEARLAAFIPPFFRMLARRLPVGQRPVTPARSAHRPPPAGSVAQRPPTESR
jgi:SAM-dependent methyltransferase